MVAFEILWSVTWKVLIKCLRCTTMGTDRVWHGLFERLTNDHKVTLP